MHGTEQQEIVARLVAAHPIFAEATVARWVAREVELYAAAPIKGFVPILVERTVRARLSALESGAEIDLRFADLLPADDLRVDA